MTAITDPTTELPLVVVAGPRGSEPDQPRPLHARTLDDLLSAVGAGVAAFALVWLSFHALLPVAGTLGFIVSWYFVFLAMYAGLTALSHTRVQVVDRLMGAVLTLAALLVGFAVVSVIVYTFSRGGKALWHGNFFTKDAGGAGPQAPLNQGGIEHAIVGSAIQLAIAVAISLPLGLGTAVFMTEVGGWFTRILRTVVEAMTAIPDLLAGLFVYVTLVIYDHQRNGLAAALALSVTMTPIIARSAEIALRVVPGGLREASLALGASYWQTVRRVVVPTARPGLATSLILAVARGIGESAPLLIVSGATTYFNKNPLKDPMNSLPLYIYTNARSGENLSIDRAFGAASVLLAIVFVLFIVTRFLARQRTTR